VDAQCEPEGFRLDRAALDIPVRDRNGRIRHDRGVVAGTPGLYVLGLPVLRTRASTYIHGAAPDVESLASHLHSFLSGPPPFCPGDPIRKAAADDHAAALKVWSKPRRDLGRTRTQVVCRPHAVYQRDHHGYLAYRGGSPPGLNRGGCLRAFGAQAFSGARLRWYLSRLAGVSAHRVAGAGQHQLGGTQPHRRLMHVPCHRLARVLDLLHAMIQVPLYI